MDISESAAEDMCIMRLASFINEMKLTELWCKIILLGSCMEVSSLMPHPLLLEELERRPSTRLQLFMWTASESLVQIEP